MMYERCSTSNPFLDLAGWCQRLSKFLTGQFPNIKFSETTGANNLKLYGINDLSVRYKRSTFCVAQISEQVTAANLKLLFKPHLEIDFGFPNLTEIIVKKILYT